MNIEKPQAKKKKMLKVVIPLMVILVAIFISSIFINKQIEEENIFEDNQISSNVNHQQGKEKGISLLVSSSKGISEINKKESQKKKDTPLLRYFGQFKKIDYNVKGEFKIYQKEDSFFLRVENLDIVNGPDLYLIVSNQKPSFGNKDYRIIAKLRANQGSFNERIPNDLNVGNYKYLLIHCKAFSHTFAGGDIIKK